MERHLQPFLTYLADYKKNRFDVTSKFPSTLQIKSSDMGEEVSRALCNQIAHTALIHSVIKVEDQYDDLSTNFYARGYCFQEEKLLELLSTVFAAGFKAGQTQDVPFSRKR